MSEQYLTIDRLSTKQIRNFFRKIQVSTVNFHKGVPCWEWTAVTTSGGYGQTGYNRRMHHAHRIAYAWLVEPIPCDPLRNSLLVVDHQCNNRRCVNPIHLQLITCRENTLRGSANAALNVLKIKCPYGHPYDEENTYYDGRGKRECRLCRKRHSQQARARRTAAQREAVLEYQQQYYAERKEAIQAKRKAKKIAKASAQSR